jgi:hypothetical protein
MFHYCYHGALWTWNRAALQYCSMKRQQLDGRNYQIEILRPKVISIYQNHMGWVDRHNRFRQDILGLQNIWKTKRW